MSIIIQESEQQKQERQKQESEQQKQNEFLEPFLENFCSRVRDRMMGMPTDFDVKTYIETIDIKQRAETAGCLLRDIKETDIGNEELYVFMDDFLEQVFYIHCVMELEYKKQKALEVQEQEKLMELKDLEYAKPIFEMLKMEVLKAGCEFDEWTISIYIKEMLEYARKHKVDLGVDLVSEEEKETEI